tara:strand:- start:83 stop:346 length:264 start_codon:yes stop_codon:yes gene_type:complete
MRLLDINMDEELDFDNMSEEEIDEILLYSEMGEDLDTRYIIACQIIANMIEDMEYSDYSNSEMVDMTICKMLIDNLVDVEKKPRSYH